MGRIKYSSAVIAISGKLGGQYLSGKVISSMPPGKRNVTPRQQARLTTNHALSQRWRKLTPAQRLSWLSVPGSDGLNGMNLFIQRNTARLLVGMPVLTSRPRDRGASILITSFGIAKSNNIIIGWTVPAADINKRLVIYIARPVSPGQRHLPRSWVVATVQPYQSNPTITLNVVYINRYGQLYPRSQRLFFKFVAIDVRSGESSAPVFFNGTRL